MSRLDRVTLQLGVAVAAVIAVCSYAVSATSLYALGLQAGYSWWQAAAVPVVADGPAIYGMFRIISRSRRGAPGAGYGWLLVGCGTLASIGGNVAHAHPNLVAQAIAAAIPLAVLAMLEGLKGDAGEVTRLAAQAADRDRTDALVRPPQRPQATTVRRSDPPADLTRAAAALDSQRRALPAGWRPADTTSVGDRLQAAYAQPRPDGQPWTARTLADRRLWPQQRRRLPATPPPLDRGGSSVSRPRWQLGDAALGYAARGIPVLPLHYPLLHHGGLQPVPGDQQPVVRTGCSCRDPSCGQPAKHPLGSLVPHGVKDATTNRARILAWWTRHPQANIGLATGHRFDVLDVDGPEGTQAIRGLAATHSLHSSGPLVHTGGGGWHYYLVPTGLGNVHPAGLEHVDWRGRGGYVVAPPSRHASGHPYQWAGGRDLDTPLAQVPPPLRARLDHPSQVRPPGPVELPATGAAPGDRYARVALAEELARVATAPVGHRNRQLWESTRNLYNLVATGALDHRQVNQGLLAAAERCGLLGEELRQTHRTLASGRQVGLAHPGRPRQPIRPERAHASPTLPARAAGERTKEGR